MSSVEQLKQEARRQEDRDNWVEAIELYGRAVAAAEEDGITPSDVGLYNRIGDLYLKLDDTSQAVYHYLMAVDHYAEEELFPSAIALCRKVLRVAPDQVDAYRKLANLHVSTGLEADARREFDRYLAGVRDTGEVETAVEGLDELASALMDGEFDTSLFRELREEGEAQAAFDLVCECWDVAQGGPEAEGDGEDAESGEVAAAGDAADDAPAGTGSGSRSGAAVTADARDDAEETTPVAEGAESDQASDSGAAAGEDDDGQEGGAAGDAPEIRATDAAERLAEEYGLELDALEGSGKDGRIVKADVEAAASEQGGGDEPEAGRDQEDPEDAEETAGPPDRGAPAPGPRPVFALPSISEPTPGDREDTTGAGEDREDAAAAHDEAPVGEEVTPVPPDGAPDRELVALADDTAELIAAVRRSASVPPADADPVVQPAVAESDTPPAAEIGEVDGIGVPVVLPRRRGPVLADRVSRPDPEAQDEDVEGDAAATSITWAISEPWLDLPVLPPGDQPAATAAKGLPPDGPPGERPRDVDDEDHRVVHEEREEAVRAERAAARRAEEAEVAAALAGAGGRSGELASAYLSAEGGAVAERDVAVRRRLEREEAVRAERAAARRAEEAEVAAALAVGARSSTGPASAYLRAEEDAAALEPLLAPEDGPAGEEPELEAEAGLEKGQELEEAPEPEAVPETVDEDEEPTRQPESASDPEPAREADGPAEKPEAEEAETAASGLAAHSRIGMPDFSGLLSAIGWSGGRSEGDDAETASEEERAPEPVAEAPRVHHEPGPATVPEDVVDGHPTAAEVPGREPAADEARERDQASAADGAGEEEGGEADDAPELDGRAQEVLAPWSQPSQRPQSIGIDDQADDRADAGGPDDDSSAADEPSAVADGEDDVPDFTGLLQKVGWLQGEEAS